MSAAQEMDCDWNNSTENTSARSEFFGNEKKDFSIYIGNIPQGLDERGLYNLLLNFGGKPVNIRMVRCDTGTGRIAFADFTTMRAVMKLIQDLNEKPPLFLRVQIANKKGAHERDDESPQPTFLPQLKRPPSDHERPTTWAVGRGALRRSTAVHRAYKNHMQSRAVNDSGMWSTGPGDIYDANKYMHGARNAHEEVNLELLGSSQGASRSDGRRLVTMGRGYHVYPKRKPSGRNGSRNAAPTTQYYDNVSQGVYSFGKDIEVASVPCLFCQTLTVKRCGECLGAYCSEECQTRDWNNHRTQCKVNVCVDITRGDPKSERRIISLKPLSEPIQMAEISAQNASQPSVRSTACVIDVMRQHMQLDGVMEITKLSQESKSVYGPLCCTAASEALSKLLTELPAHLDKTPLPPLSTFSPEKGTMVGVFNKESWWRGLILSSPTQNVDDDEYRVGVTDLAKIVTARRADLRPLPPAYAALPEFGMKATLISSLVQEDDLWSTYLQVGKDLQLHVEAAEGATISCLVKSDDKVKVCRMQFQRWDPEAQLRERAGEGRVVALTPKCRAVLTCFHNQFALFVRPTGKQHVELRNTVLQQVAASHALGSPLGRAPRRDEMVACRCEQDGNYYRAVVREASLDHVGKYKVWFVDFGNIADAGIEDMRILSEHIKNYPFLAVKIALREVRDNKLTPGAIKYLNELLDKEEVLTVEFENSIESGVELTTRDGTNVNAELNMLLLPSWIIAAQNNKNLYEDRVFMLEDLAPLPLIADDKAEVGEMAVIVLHVNVDQGQGVLLCCPADSPIVPVVATSLVAQINEFCDSPHSDLRYNPRLHEICLARHQDGSWQRALSVESIEGGSRVVFLDFGGTQNVLFPDIRRILPDFMTMPTLISSCIIQGLPTKLTDGIKSKLKELIKVNTILQVQNVKPIGDSTDYAVDVPQLINALRAAELI